MPAAHWFGAHSTAAAGFKGPGCLRNLLTTLNRWKEHYGLITACCTWGKEWCQLRITMHCDNKAVVD